MAPTLGNGARPNRARPSASCPDRYVYSNHGPNPHPAFKVLILMGPSAKHCPRDAILLAVFRALPVSFVNRFRLCRRAVAFPPEIFDTTTYSSNRRQRQLWETTPVQECAPCSGLRIRLVVGWRIALIKCYSGHAEKSPILVLMFQGKAKQIAS